jgi:hypothetical protein
VFDEHAGIHYHRDSCAAGLFGGRLVGDAELHPDYFGTDANRGVYYWRNFFGAAENVDDFNFLGGVFETRITVSLGLTGMIW